MLCIAARSAVIFVAGIDQLEVLAEFDS